VGPDPSEQGRRERVRATSEAKGEAERAAAVGAPRGARGGDQRQGSRQGGRARRRTTSLGPTPWRGPRARLPHAAGGTQAGQSRMLPRSQRRTARVAEASLGGYLSGTNRRRLNGALAPGRRGGPFSKEAGSGLGGRLKRDVEEGRPRDLSPEGIGSVMVAGG